MEKPPFPLSIYLRVFTASVAVVLLSAAGARAVWHLNDLSGMRHIAGDWMALAQSLNRGVLYPPLEEDGYYAGTRYMPLLFCLIAGVQRLVGDYLLATKLVTLIVVIALAAATCAVVRRITGRWLEAIALGALIVAFPEGLMALLSPHADALAVALSVWGLFILASEKLRIGPIVLAALLMGLAFGTKFSAVAAPAAAVIFLLPKKPKATLALTAIVAGLALSGLALIHFASQGRFEENFRALASGGMTLDFMKMAPGRLVWGLVNSALVFAFVVPFVLPLAILTVCQHLLNRSLTLWDWYFLMANATTLFIFGSPGTDLNHLLELEVASVLVVAQRFTGAAAKATPVADEALVSRIVLLLPLLIGAYVAVKNPGWRHASGEGFFFWQQREPTFAELVAALPPEPHLLTEDSTPVVLLGQRPVVMDAFAFKVLAENRVIDDQKLADRILRGEFNGLLMLRELDKPSRLEQFHFGPKVNDALRQDLPRLGASTVGLMGSPLGQGPFQAVPALIHGRTYRFDRQVGQYFIYLPAQFDKDDKPGQK
jgi:hypothetical protein